jgi:hypothetical protein
VTTNAFRGFTVKGAWCWEPGERDRFTAHLKSLKDGAWEIPPAKRPTRSQKANAYYWSTVLPLLAAENAQTPEEVHDAMCEMFLPNELKRIEFFNRMTGEVQRITIDCRRSSKLEGKPFYEFVERVRLWGLEFLGVITPDPDPAYWMKKGSADVD